MNYICLEENEHAMHLCNTDVHTSVTIGFISLANKEDSLAWLAHSMVQIYWTEAAATSTIRAFLS